MRTTITYPSNSKDNPRQEKLVTLKEFVQMGRLVVGQCLYIGDVDEKGLSSNTENIWIGDATPYHEPSTSDGGFGWNYDNPTMKKYVIEVHEHR